MLNVYKLPEYGYLTVYITIMNYSQTDFIGLSESQFFGKNIYFIVILGYRSA